jgi:hypothetical protein
MVFFSNRWLLADMCCLLQIRQAWSALTPFFIKNSKMVLPLWAFEILKSLIVMFDTWKVFHHIQFYALLQMSCHS